jgi:hypothetical protein
MAVFGITKLLATKAAVSEMGEIILAVVLSLNFIGLPMGLNNVWSNAFKVEFVLLWTLHPFDLPT